MDNNNPLSPHIQIYRWHISSLVSISHRITGIINIVAITIICFWIATLLLGESSYEFIKIFLKCSSVVLIPLMFWFILNLVSVYDKNYIEVVNFFSKQPSKLLVSLLLVIAYFFSALSISEVFEDYIKDNKIKNAANKALNIFAIIMPLITIIIIFNLKI